MFAVLDLTNGDTSRCLIATGSYVSGDGGPLQSWSTSSYTSQNDPSGITTPDLVANEFTRSHTIALPYAIKGVFDVKTMHTYENECLDELNVRCWMARMMGTPYKCILLELMLASNGASLSDRALSRLAALAEKHNLDFIVDEIMTGGRTGSILMLDSKPKAFTDRVSHVTLGKWLQVGIVLESSNFFKHRPDTQDHTLTRGSSTIMDCKQVLLYWNEVCSNLSVSTVRREMVSALGNLSSNLTIVSI